MSEAKTEGGMFLVIPSVVMLDEELPMSAKMLYGVIVWKCGQNAYTWNSNRKLGEAIGLSPKRVSALLSLLEKNGHIETEIEYKDGTKEISSRYIYPIMKSAKDMRKRDQAEDEPPDDDGTPPPENGDTPHPKNGDTPPLGNEDTPPPENKCLAWGCATSLIFKKTPPWFMLYEYDSTSFEVMSISHLLRYTKISS
jgi:hypothetical protein